MGRGEGHSPVLIGWGRCCSAFGSVYSRMASRQRRAILIHNEKAGDKRHEREALVDLLERAGYSVSYFPAKTCDLGEVLGHLAEIIVSACGVGTVGLFGMEAGVVG